MKSTTQSFILLTGLTIIEFYTKSNPEFAECVARKRIASYITPAIKEFVNYEVTLQHHFLKRTINILANLSIHFDTDDREKVLQFIERLPATHDINIQISIKKVKILVVDNNNIVTFTADEIQLVVKKLKEACIYQREEKFKSLLVDLTLFCVNDNNISLICSLLPLRCLRYADVYKKNELLIKLLQKLMIDKNFVHKIAGDEFLMRKNGLNTLKKEIKVKSREFLEYRNINEERTAENRPTSPGEGSTSAKHKFNCSSKEKTDLHVRVNEQSDIIEFKKIHKTKRRNINEDQTADSGSSDSIEIRINTNSRRTINWSIKEKTDLLVLVKEQRNIIELKKRDETTRLQRKKTWENIESQFKSQNPKFTHLKTKGIIEQYQRLKSQVKKQLSQQDVSTISGETSIDKSIVKLMCEICQEEFKNVMPVFQDNNHMTSEEYENGDNDIEDNAINEDDYIDVTEHQEGAEEKALEIPVQKHKETIIDDDNLEDTEHENERIEQHTYRAENNLVTHSSVTDINYVSESPSFTTCYSTSPARSHTPEPTISLYQGQENLMTISSTVLETSMLDEITTHPFISDYQVNNMTEASIDYTSHQPSSSRQHVNPRTGVSRTRLKRKTMPYIRSKASKRKLEQEEIKLKREKQQEELKLAREKQAEEMRMVREKHEMEMEMLRLKKQCLERQLQQPGNTSGIFTSTQNVLDGDGASYLSLL